jgi:YidC/Oxa1 family membrane protein insertase
MISSIWHSAVYQPLYNLLMLLVDFLPGHSVGAAIIVLTIIVKLALFPLTSRSIVAQREMKKLQPELQRLKDEHKEDKKKLAEHTMALYQEKGVTPFSGCLPMIIQIPIVIGLYWVFSRGLKIHEVDMTVLYNFVRAPGSLDMHFLFFDLAGKSLVLAMCAGIAQYFQTDISLGQQPPPPPKKKGQEATFQDDFAQSMQMQMRYILPVMISFIAYSTSAAVALYWTTSNILSIVQELLLKRKGNKKKNS